MRIETQNPTRETAGGAPAPGVRSGDAVAGYDALLSVLGASLDGSEPGAGPMGIAEAASRELNDPLGLATRHAAVTPTAAPVAGEGPEANAGGTDATGRGGTPRGATPSRPPGGAAGDLGLPLRTGGSSHDRPGAMTDASGPAGGRGTETRGETPGSGGAATVAPSQVGSRLETGTDAGRAPGAAGRVSAVAGAGASGGSSAGGSSASGPGFAPLGLSGTRAALGKTGAAPSTAHPQHLRTQQAEVAPQVAKGLAALVLRDGGRAQIQLRPEALGRVEVDLSIRDGVVNATMSAENETARDLLGSELDRLRAMLEQRGLRVESLEIVSDPAEPEARGGADADRGSRWMSAQDESRGNGKDAGTGSPGSGGRDDRARDGVPMPRAERGRPGQDAGTAEIGAALETGDLGAIGGRSPPGLWVRLDTVA